MDWNQQIIEEFRENAGKVGGPFDGAPLVLLTTTGARSGRPHTTPVMYLAEGDDLYVFASNAGRPANPAWFHNIVAHPEITVEIGEGDTVGTYRANAVPLRGEERDRVYARQAALVPAFAEYQANTSRVIPVVRLLRLPAGAPAGSPGEFLTWVHDRLRQDLAAVRAELDEYVAAHAGAADGARPKPGLGLQLRTHCLAFCESLGGHHTNEDGGFDLIEQRFPESKPMLDRLRQEHEVVARTLRELRALLAEAETGDPRRIRDEFTRLASGLEDHFAYEEDQLVPVLDKMA